MPTLPRRALVSLAAVAAAALAPVAARAQSARRGAAVLQVSDADPAKWNLALNNARNAREDLGADALELEVVVYGPGIGMLKADSPVAARIAEAMKSGIKVSACENTMRGFKLTKADMLPEIGYVPSGVGEIIRRQQQGWAYLRP